MDSSQLEDLNKELNSINQQYTNFNKVDKINSQLEHLDTDYNLHQKYQKTKQELQEQLKEDESINNRLINMRQDKTKFINSKTIRNFENKPEDTSQNLYKHNNKPLFYDQKSIIPNYKKSGRDNMNSRIDEFVFNNNIPNLKNSIHNPNYQNYPNNGKQITNQFSNNHQYRENIQNIQQAQYSPNIQLHPSMHKPVYDNLHNNTIMGTGMKQSNFVPSSVMEPVYSKNRKGNNRSMNNQKMSDYSPLGRALGMPLHHNNLSHMDTVVMPNQQNYRSNYRESNSARLSQYTPLAKTSSFPQKNGHPKSVNTRQNIITKPSQSKRPQYNYNDVNPHRENSVMTLYPVNTRMD